MWLSLSFAILGVLLLFKRFHWSYGLACVLIAGLGNFYSIVFVLPYLWISCTILQELFTSRNCIKTNSPLYICKRRESHNNSSDKSQQNYTESAADAYWIVATKVCNRADKNRENDNCSSNIDQSCKIDCNENVAAIRNDEWKIQFKKLQCQLEDQYCLHNLGWVNCKLGTSSGVVEKECTPCTGYSFLSVALSTAYYMSTTPLCTYIKTLVLLRLYAVMCYTALIFVTFVYECYTGTILTTCPLCVILINLIIVVDLCWLYTSPGNVVFDTYNYVGEKCVQTCYDIPLFVESKSFVSLSAIPSCSAYFLSCFCSPVYIISITAIITMLEIVCWVHTEAEKIRCGAFTAGSALRSWMMRRQHYFNRSYFYYITSFLTKVTPSILISLTTACYLSGFCSPVYFVIIITVMPTVEYCRAFPGLFNYPQQLFSWCMANVTNCVRSCYCYTINIINLVKTQFINAWYYFPDPFVIKIVIPLIVIPACGTYVVIYHYGSTVQKVDMTMMSEKRGSLIVETVVDRIRQSMIFHDDFGYIRRICWVETQDGANYLTTFRPGYHGGLWRVDEVNFEVTKDTTTYSQLLQKYDLIKSEFGIDWLVVQWRDLRTPLYCGLAIWLYMCTIEEPIPSNIDDQADHWKRNYNPEKNPEDFVNPVREWERNYPGSYCIMYILNSLCCEYIFVLNINKYSAL